MGGQSYIPNDGVRVDGCPLRWSRDVILIPTRIFGSEQFDIYRIDTKIEHYV